MGSVIQAVFWRETVRIDRNDRFLAERFLYLPVKDREKSVLPPENGLDYREH